MILRIRHRTYDPEHLAWAFSAATAPANNLKNRAKARDGAKEQGVPGKIRRCRPGDLFQTAVHRSLEERGALLRTRPSAYQQNVVKAVIES